MTSAREQQLARLRGRVGRLSPDRVAVVIEELVVTERGYLDMDGQVYLHEDSIRGAVDGINGSLVDRRTITLAIQYLLYRGRAQEVTGCRRSDGSIAYPPVEGMPSVRLLQFQTERYHPWSEGDGRDDGDECEADVYGHTRKLQPGQRASDDAVQAHREAQDRGQVANDGPLPTGYTFVTEHRRQYRSHSHGPVSRSDEPVDDNTVHDEDEGYHRYT